MALNSSNSNAEPKIGAGALSNFNTENKSNGNFSGGDINFDASKLSINNPFNTNNSQQPTFNLDDVFTPTVSGNLDINKSSNNSSSSSNTTYSNNSNEPTMTVDEVYGKSSNNQPVVEKQGDYSASSNEKSKVETSTFGKQDEVSVTPTSVTENKGMVGNATIQSVEGLDFQQKDKASVDVLDSKKKRDEVEAEDKADSMRNKLKASVDKDAEETETDAFKVGESEAEKAYNDEDASWQQVLQEQKAQIDAYKQSIEDSKAEVAQYEASVEKGRDGMKADLEQAKTELAYDTKTLETLQASYDEMEQQYNSWKDDSKSKVEKGEMVEALAAKAKEKANKAFEVAQKEREYAVAKQWNDLSKESIQRDIINAVEILTNARPDSEEYNQAMAELQNINQDYIGLFRGDRNAYKNPGKMLEAITNEYDSQTARFKSVYDAIANSKESEETKAHATEVLENVEKSVYAVEDAANALAVNPNDPASVKAYVDAIKTYNENLENALKDDNISKTDFNKAFTEMVAKTNDFDVTLPDGTKRGFVEFATEMATKSPQVAKAMYEAKAQEYEDEKHPILAKIERWKAKMSQTWLGSKFTFADNQVRNQFNQMAKTDMRATYATYNNVLNDPNATPEQKAEASKSINQAKALMTASAALQASTGFLSGIGDGMDDGVYGTTDPKAINAWQKTLNTVDNLIKITLGLGVTPGANKAYQNMYYMAGDKVNESGLFTTDFDSDGFALCQEYGNNAATGMIAGAGELAVGVAMMFNPLSAATGLNLITGSVQTFLNGLYGVRNEAEKSQQYTQEVLEYFKDAENIAESSGNEEAVQEITNAITQIENFELKADEVGNLDNWLEGSGSNTASNEKFNQSLTYDEWLKLIEADPTMREFAKSLTEKKKDKNAQKDNADTGVNS